MDQFVEHVVGVAILSMVLIAIWRLVKIFCMTSNPETTNVEEYLSEIPYFIHFEGSNGAEMEVRHFRVMKIKTYWVFSFFDIETNIEYSTAVIRQAFSPVPSRPNIEIATCRDVYLFPKPSLVRLITQEGRIKELVFTSNQPMEILPNYETSEL